MDLAIVRFQLLCELTCALELMFLSSLEKICLLSPLINKLKVLRWQEKQTELQERHRGSPHGLFSSPHPLAVTRWCCELVTLTWWLERHLLPQAG